MTRTPRPPREGSAPGRMASLALMRKALLGAQDYDRRLRQYNEKSEAQKQQAEKPPREIGFHVRETAPPYRVRRSCRR